MGGEKPNKIYNLAAQITSMASDPEDSIRHGREGVKALRQTNEQKWAELAEETALTERQVAMWELAVRYDLKQMYIAQEYDIKESTVSRHVEVVRKKRDETDERIEELKDELQQWKETKEYFED